MKDDIWQKRQFILSSFTRSEISITNSVYRFVDKIIKEEWDLSSYINLSDLDHFIREEFGKFIGNT